jgi:hypothetical protein
MALTEAWVAGRLALCRGSLRRPRRTTDPQWRRFAMAGFRRVRGRPRPAGGGTGAGGHWAMLAAASASHYGWDTVLGRYESLLGSVSC